MERKRNRASACAAGGGGQKKKRNLVRDCANRCRRNRTFNLRIKSPMLCQLSYAPLKRPYEWWDSNPHAKDTGT